MRFASIVSLAGIFCAVGMIVSSCAPTDDMVSVKKVPVGRADFGDFESTDSTTLCPSWGCRDLTSDELNSAHTIVDWLQSGPYTECGQLSNALSSALSRNKVKAVDHFDSDTQKGAYTNDDGMIYIRKDIMAGGAGGFNVQLGHEAAHAAGMGAYKDHETDMNNLSYTCQPASRGGSGGPGPPPNTQ